MIYGDFKCCFVSGLLKEEGLDPIPAPDECGIGDLAPVLENGDVSHLAHGLRKGETEKRNENDDRKAFLL